MIELKAVSSAKSRPITELLVLPFYKGEKKPVPLFSHKLEETIQQVLAMGDFLGKEAETLLVYSQSTKEKRVLLLGLGEKNHCTSECMRKAGALVAKFCRKKKLRSATVALSDESFMEGLLLGAYTFDSLKGQILKEDPPVMLEKVYVLDADRSFNKKMEKLVEIVGAVNFVRDLVNGNADEIHSESLIQFSRELSKQYPKLKTSVLMKSQLEAERMGLLLAVNQGAVREPALIVIEYRGDPKVKHTTALVGKGITFDTGGLNLKPTGSMETMKCDMAGAATVLGIMRGAASLKLKANLIGVLAIAENAIGSRSFKPGDVYKSRSGKTVEISNTDAEGRLVLADAITYVEDLYAPTQIIDFATLTGGIVVALGEEFTGLYSNDDNLAKALTMSGEETGERVWRMPLGKEYLGMLKSKIADIKNSAGRKASPCTAAAFIQAFLPSRKEKKGGQIPWAHLDIAGTAFLDEPRDYHTSQATGVCIRLMLDFFSR